MEETRKFAFFKDGIYYKPNSTKTKLIAITSDTANWMTQEEVENLSGVILALVADYDLVINSTIPEDEYTVHLENYDIVCTTDKTQISTKGMRWLSKATPSGSDTCKIIFSFDNRKTWYKFSTLTNKFEQINYDSLYASGTPLSAVESITKEQWDQIFARTALDYAVTVNTGETFTSLTLNFPGNTAPDIESITISADEIHDENVVLNVKVIDFEEDDMHYELYLNGSQTPFIEQNVNPLSNGNLYIRIPNDDLIVGTNNIRFKIYDDKNAFNERTVTVVKNNIVPLAIGLIDNDLFSFTITDEDADTIQYSITLNGEEILPMTELLTSPFTTTYKIPRGKIIFGRENTLVLSYQDKIKQNPLEALTMKFQGYYYGILFYDPEQGLKDPVNPDGSLSNARFYSTSLGDILRNLDLGTIYENGTTKSHEIGIINLSNTRFVTTNITWAKDNKDVVLHMSKKRAPFLPDEIQFYDLEKGDTASFFVRLQSKTDNAIGDYTTFIKAEAQDR